MTSTRENDLFIHLNQCFPNFSSIALPEQLTAYQTPPLQKSKNEFIFRYQQSKLNVYLTLVRRMSLMQFHQLLDIRFHFSQKQLQISSSHSVKAVSIVIQKRCDGTELTLY